MDLDQLIRNADPAQRLQIDIPDPTHRGARGHHRRGELMAVALAVATAVAVAVIALSTGKHHPITAATVPAQLPFSSPASPAAATGVLPRTVRLVQTFPDPQSGPAWGMRTYQTRSGMTCVQAGRTESGVVGAIGIDGDFGSDMRFHPFALKEPDSLGDCEPDDAHGHAFINVDAVSTAASAGEAPCMDHDDAEPRQHCAASTLRDVYFGLLGPDAASVTYVGPGGRRLVERTRGRDGAYLVVTPVAHGSCNRALMRRVGTPSTCDASGGGGEGLGATLRSGEITAVSYHDGHVCHLPAPQGVIVRLAQCPVVGYVPLPGPRYTAAQITTPVTVRKLPARLYCDHPGIYRPAAVPIPCDGAVPAGYVRAYFTHPRPGAPSSDPGQNLLVYISWAAHGSVTNTSHSSYSLGLHYPKGCGAGGEVTGTQTRIRAGQNITRSFYVPTKCRGTYTGAVTYVPNLGPNGENGGPLDSAYAVGEGRGIGHGLFLVGRFAFTVP
jgi:hypothetical protein